MVLSDAAWLTSGLIAFSPRLSIYSYENLFFIRAEGHRERSGYDEVVAERSS